MGSMETNREQVRNQYKHDGEQQTQTKKGEDIHILGGKRGGDSWGTKHR